jgi:hypothetical protein
MEIRREPDIEVTADYIGIRHENRFVERVGLFVTVENVGTTPRDLTSMSILSPDGCHRPLIPAQNQPKLPCKLEPMRTFSTEFHNEEVVKGAKVLFEDNLGNSYSAMVRWKDNPQRASSDTL